MQTRASAKINSCLEVLARREDGFHEIRTVFHELELHDTLRFTLTKIKDIQIFANVKSLQNQDNLVCRISHFIQNAYSVNAGVSIELEKAIPVAAGLGGGSSDAAATILACNTLWSLNMSDQEMHDIAAQFGSDINFFLIGGRAVGQGRGEQLVPLEDRLIDDIVLVNPGFAVSSGEAYRAVETVGGDDDRWRRYLADGDLSLTHNALQAGVCKAYPVIAETLAEMKQECGRAMLSGSGPTMIAFCDSPEQARRMADRYGQRGWWSTVTKTVSRSAGMTGENQICRSTT